LNYAQLKNSSGQFVAPTDSGMRAGLKLSKMFSEGDEGANLIDLEGRDTWPILDATYILLDAQPKSAARTTQTLRFFYWAFEKGDTLLKDTGFVPLPPVVQARVIRYLSEVRPVDGQKIFFMW
jgi:phosphate transport system substrate-binding protein